MASCQVLVTGSLEFPAQISTLSGATSKVSSFSAMSTTTLSRSGVHWRNCLEKVMASRPFPGLSLRSGREISSSARASSRSLAKQPDNVVVVGAGPAGCLMAIYLARRGFNVHLFERRSRLMEASQAYVAGGSRSYTMLLTSRAIRALEGADIQVPSSLMRPLIGGCSHLPNGGTRIFSYSSDPGLKSYGISRNSLAAFLQDTLLTRYGNRVTSHYGWEVVGIDEENCTVEFRRSAKDSGQGNDSEESTKAEYDFLIGADGVSSKTRTILLDLDRAHRRHNEDRSPMTMNFTPNSEIYKTFYVRPSVAQSSPLYAHDNYVQSWPALNVLLVCMADGSFWGLSRHPGLMKATNAEEVEQIFRQKAPDLFNLLLQEDGSFPEHFAKQPAISFGGAVLLSRFHHRNMVLIGDAAHAMFPPYGTGCNAALEDCWLLDQIIEEHQSSSGGAVDFSVVATEFTMRRLADAHAIVQMNSSLELLPGGFRGLAQMAVITTLNKLFPSFIKPTAFQLLWSLMPFSEIRRQKRVENLLFYTVVAALATIAVLLLLKSLRYFKLN